jgi:UDP-N-acetylmuramate: L-alanyl-gamma-D-glutamyl-meso-diaminopimelate ligase
MQVLAWSLRKISTIYCAFKRGLRIKSISMRVHFIAIGGSVMHQLALALLKKGYKVSGSDDEIFEPAKSNLEQAGLPVENGWHPERIPDKLDAVILGMHAKMDNPELQKAMASGLKNYSFPEYIYHESRDKQRIVAGGSHGKTSTTAMIMHVMKFTGKSFNYLPKNS